MKKLFAIAALAALSSTSCSFDKEVEVKQDTIGFGTYVGKTNTKAVEETSTDIRTGSTIGIFAFNSAADISSTNLFAANFMSNEKLYYNGGWKYDNTKYWPNNGSKISFVAYHPYTDVTAPLANATDVTNIPTVNTDGTVTIPFIVNLANPSAQKDLLYAYNPNLTKQSGPVTFAFNHALSKIQFKMKLDLSGVDATYDNCTVRIKKVELINLIPKATLEINPVTGGRWIDKSMSSGACTVYNPTLESDRQVVTSTSTGLSTSADKTESFATTGLLLLPQSLIDTKLKIQYEVKYTDGVTINESSEFALKDKGYWVRNNIYTYTFNISLNAITFDVAVTPWDTTVPEIPVNN